MNRCSLEICEFDGDEAVMFRVFVGLHDDELEDTEGLSQGDEFCLELVEKCEGGYCFVESGDFGLEAHVFSDFTNYLGIVDSFCLKPGPQGEEFCAGIADRVVEDRGTHVLEAGGEKIWIAWSAAAS